MSFKLLKNEYIEDVNSEGFLYEHTSGAKLIYLKNIDNNKVFSVTFKTLPYNDTGVAHIMEHSVLCGSKHYRLKDPFNELQKCSINTYLNAITFFDKTMYPVASTNEHDFIKLMKVYLDAVFFPLIYEHKEIFLQEGWHYTKDGINGVVYNEMKGAFSSPEKVIDTNLKRHLFKDNNYKFYSGGIPQFIPELTYDEFIDFHRNYYHPSNSILYLYGDIDIEKYLEIIDNNYLNCFEKKDFITNYILQKGSQKTSYNENEYFLNGKESIENENYIAAGFCIGTSLDYELSMAFDILCSAILNRNSSPIKNVFLEANICKNIIGTFYRNMYQPSLFIRVEKTNQNDIKQFKNILYTSFENIVHNGINTDLINGCINRNKFYLYEQDFGYKPKGLFYNIKLMNGFLYGDEAFESIRFNKILSTIENIDYSTLVEKYLLNNDNCSFEILIAKNDNKALKNNTLRMKNDENDEIKLKKYQSEKEQNTDVIPMINLSDINKNIEVLYFDVNEISSSKVIYTSIDSPELVYLNFLFDVSKIPLEFLQYIKVLNCILGKVSTYNYSKDEIINMAGLYLGGLRINFDTYNNNAMFVCIKVKLLKDNICIFFDLLNEIIFNTNFDNKSEIKKLIIKLKANFEKNYISNSNSYAISRCVSYFNKRYRYAQEITGINFYKNLLNIINEIDNNFDNVVYNLKNVAKYLFTKENIMISISSYKKHYDFILNKCEKFYNNLSDETFKKAHINFESNVKNEAFIINSNIQYNVIASNFKEFHYTYNGYFKVLKKILDTEYLWNEIRVKGGAYGAFIKFFRNGITYAYSYRDPKLNDTYESYKNMYKYIENLNLSERDIKKYIIGAISILDKPLKNVDFADIALGRYINKITNDKLLTEREQVLTTTLKDIKNFSNFMYDCFANGYICTFGSEENIVKNKNLFENIEMLVN